MTTISLKSSRNQASVRDRVLRGVERLPPLSPAVGRLLSKLAFRNVNYKDLADLVEKDALLCAHILRTVNSAGFARARTITSIQQSMTLLGIGRLRRIAVGFTVGNLFSKTKTAPNWSRQRFNLHSGATAILTEAIADSLPLENKEGAFVGGMLHDLGKLLIAVTAPDDYEIIAALVQVRGQSLLECERETLNTDHAELSGLALTKWGLPEIVCRSVYHHHSPDAPNAPWLAAVIQRADAFVNHLGITVSPPPGNAGDPPSIEIPAYEFDTLAVLQRFEKEWIELSEFFR